jgi:mono/diheme cytochrome c family protein
MHHWLVWAWCIGMHPTWLAAGGVSPVPATAEGPTGAQIYRQTCAACHGDAGEGTDDDYPQALVGDKSVGELTRFIDKEMPKDSPEDCVGPDAARVAAYIHEAFYSKAAQIRNKPPTIELSRLTVRQYRHAVADLVGGLGSPGQWDEKRGLRGEYFKSRRFRGGDRVLERLDGEVQFDFGTSSPDPGKFDDREFSIRWEGSVLVPDSGEYEFIVRTQHAARLWINDVTTPLIDAWVKSGDDVEYRASLFLLSGRVYPVRLEFSKAKQGVDDSKTNKAKPAPVAASIGLLWKPPHLAVQTIPRRYLTPNRFPTTLVVATPFPPDDRSVGYERGTSISKAWDQATTEAAVEVARYVAAHVAQLADVGDNASDRQQRLRDYCRRFAERAFRRPLDDEQQRALIDRRFDGAVDLETAVKQAVLLVLKSPRFLYCELGDRNVDGYDVATRLSLGLWDSLPDRPLLDAAQAGQLATREQVARQAERMLTDLRSRAKLREFFLQWLKVQPAPDLIKDPRQFPGFDAALSADLRTSLELFLEDVLWGESGDFRELLLADYLYVNGPLAKMYGVDLPPEAEFQKVVVDPGQRAGVLSHPYVAATFAYTGASSPIHRGVFIARSVLGRSLRPPPQAVVPLPPDLHADLTTRQRVTLQTSAKSCQQCHGLVNPLGFPLEHFDAIGRYRKEEKGHAIDATGSYQTRSDQTAKLDGARDLAKFLAASEETHTTLVEQLFQYLVKQPIYAFGPQTPSELRQSWAKDGFNVRRLMVEIMATSALAPRGAKP